MSFRTAIVASALVFGSVAGAIAQTAATPPADQIAFDRPEAWAPLTVKRPGSSASEIDPLVNARAVVSDRVIR